MAVENAKKLLEANGFVVTGAYPQHELAIATELENMACAHAQRVFGFSHMGGTEEDVRSLRLFLKTAVRRPSTNVEPHFP